jgi:hypothetical protein
MHFAWKSLVAEDNTQGDHCRRHYDTFSLFPSAKIFAGLDYINCKSGKIQEDFFFMIACAVNTPMSSGASKFMKA